MKFKLNTFNTNVQTILMHDLNELFYFISEFVNRNHHKSVILDLIDQEKNTWLVISDMIERMILSLQKLLEQIIPNNHVETYPELTMFQHSLENIINNFKQLKNVNNLQDHVVWFETQTKNGKKNIYIYMQHFNIAPILSNHLFKKKKSVILTSATLTV